MISLPKPIATFSDAFRICINDINDDNEAYKRKLLSAEISLLTQSIQYNLRAPLCELQSFPVARHGHDDDIAVIGGSGVTKGELVELYSGYFSKKGKNSRIIYDQIKIASSGSCCMCLIGRVTTLDHYLPKARYPTLSIEPNNLVPACADCNKGKGSSLLQKKDDHVLHPYFSDQKYYTQNWISGRLIETLPPVMTFFVNPPDEWGDFDKTIVRKHFNSFNLAENFSIFISSHLVTAIGDVAKILEGGGSVNDVKDNFTRNALQRKNPNSPITVMYKVLSASDWFCSSPRCSPLVYDYL